MCVPGQHTQGRVVPGVARHTRTTPPLQRLGHYIPITKTMPCFLNYLGSDETRDKRQRERERQCSVSYPVSLRGQWGILGLPLFLLRPSQCWHPLQIERETQTNSIASVSVGNNILPVIKQFYNSQL